MTEQERQQSNQMKAQINELLQWKKQRERQQIAMPLDIASGQAVVEAFKLGRFDKINVGGISIHVGSGAPTFNAEKGAIYINTTGSSTTTRMYINTDGSSTWTNITTAS